jgi:predicted MFS family arabinose efflux permease
MGLMTCVMSISTAGGAWFLGMTMERTGGSFDLFLMITGTSVLIGASLLLLLGRSRGEENAS